MNRTLKPTRSYLECVPTRDGLPRGGEPARRAHIELNHQRLENAAAVRPDCSRSNRIQPRLCGDSAPQIPFDQVAWHCKTCGSKSAANTGREDRRFWTTECGQHAAHQRREAPPPQQPRLSCGARRKGGGGGEGVQLAGRVHVVGVCDNGEEGCCGGSGGAGVVGELRAVDLGVQVFVLEDRCQLHQHLLSCAFDEVSLRSARASVGQLRRLSSRRAGRHLLPQL